MAPIRETEAIAIVGIGCRFPGNAESSSRLWTVFNDGVSAWSKFPEDRLNIEGFFHPSAARTDSFNFTGAHFLTSNVAAFDASFFGATAEEAEAMDPQQRILLEVSYEALENGGIPYDTYYGSKTCVFVGSFVKDYEQISMRDAMTAPPDLATGNSTAIMSNRISYEFNMHGTSQTIDTGCSASLVALHQAVNNLRNGQSDMALAGGAGLILTPSTIMPMTSLGFLSKDGKSYTFDHRANGYGRGEGVGMVVLKRLSDALRDNDTIRGVIRGTASNQDGRTPGITVPNPEAQVECIKEAYADANLSPDSTLYVECHGTGTQAGDFRELKAISTAFCSKREKPIYVGSAKPNIGHLEGAAGIAGVIRALLILEHGKIPPHINFLKWNPDIKHEAWKVDITLDGLDLGHELSRVSVNCFGFGGTNAHAVIDSGRSFLQERDVCGNHNVVTKSTHSLSPSWSEPGRAHLFVFSAQHAEGVKQQKAALADYIGEQMQNKGGQISSASVFLRDLAYTLYDRRSAFQFRDFVTAKKVQELVDFLTAGGMPDKVLVGQKKPMKTVFVFAGQGAQWARMGVDLVEIAPFGESLKLASEFLSSEFDLDLMSHLHLEAEKSDVDKPEISQPATTAIQMALVDLLESCGIQPSAVVGHSSGEIAAAYAAGLISRHTALRVAFYRGSAAAAMDASLQGRMLAVAMSETDANQMIQRVDAEYPQGKVVVACVNGPTRVTLSGDKVKILAIQKELGDVQGRLLDVDMAYHSHHMEMVSQRYLDMMHHTKNGPCPGQKCPMFSSVRHGTALEADMMTPDYWVENMVRPVRFDKAVSSMVEYLRIRDNMPDFIIEVSPKNQLHGPVAETLEGAGVSSDTFNYLGTMSPKSKYASALVHLFGELWKRGHKLDLTAFFHQDEDGGPTKKCLVDLPKYAWDHSKTYWVESHISQSHRFRKFGRQDLIGAPVSETVGMYQPRWRGFFRLHEMPWMAHHKVQGEMVYPAAGMMAMAIQAGWQIFQESPQSRDHELVDFEVSKFSIKSPMMIPDNEEGLEHVITAKRAETSQFGPTMRWSYAFVIYSKPGRNSPFVEHATGHVRIRFANVANRPSLASGIMTRRQMTVREEDMENITPFEFYEGLDVIGMQYGPLFRNMSSISKVQTIGGRQFCETTMTVPDTAAIMPERYEFPHVVHPATLDTMFQSVFTLGSEPMLPYSIESVRVSAHIPTDPGSSFMVETAAKREGRFEVQADINALHPEADGSGQHVPWVRIRGLRAKAVPMAAPDEALRFLPNHRHLCSQLEWKRDVDQADLGQDVWSWLDLLGHKKPGFTVLHVGSDESMVRNVFGTLAPGSDDVANPLVLSRLGRYTIYDDGADIEALRTSVPSGRASHLHRVTKNTVQEEWTKDAAPKFDLIMLERGNSMPVPISHLMRSGAFLLTMSPSDSSTTALASVHDQMTEDNGLTAVGSQITSLGQELRLYSKPTELKVPDASNIYILTPADQGNTRALLEPLMAALQNKVSVEVVGPDWLETVHKEEDDEGGLNLISLLDFAADRLLFDMEEHVFEMVKKILDLSKTLVWVTVGAQMQCDRPHNAIFQGWSRTVRSEDAQKNLVTVDMMSADMDVGSRLARICMDSFFGDADETEYCLGTEKDFIPRLIPLTNLNHVIEHGSERGLIYEQKDLAGDFENGSHHEATGHYKLAIANPGDMQSLYFAPDGEATRALRPYEVRIAVRHTVVLPQDVETVRSDARDLTIGLDLHGTVLELGAGCEVSGVAFRVGDSVVAMARGTVRTTMVLPSSMVRLERRQGQTEPVRRVGDEEEAKNPTSRQDHVVQHSTSAVWSPTMVSTVHRIMRHVRQTIFRRSRRSAGDEFKPRILLFGGVHAYGQMFRQMWEPSWNVDLWVVVGLDNNNNNNNNNNQQTQAAHETYMFDHGFLAEQLEGEGQFDVVLDLSFGHHYEVPMVQMVHDGGVFIKFSGNRAAQCDRSGVGITTLTIDPFAMSPDLLDQAFKRVRSRRNRDAFMMPAPMQTRPLSDMVGLFQHLERNPDAGEWSLVERLSRPSSSRSDMARVEYRPHLDGLALDSTDKAPYLVVGGMGGLGQDMVMWLASKGAKDIVVASRSGLSSLQGERLASWRRLLLVLAHQGVSLQCLTVDICDYQDLRDALSKLPAVAGCIHAAGVLHDATYRTMTHAAWTAAAAVKTRGSWNLHRLLPAGMSFLVFLSSAAGVIGNRGQANYAAGNAFQDALARHRSARNMNTVSLDLGPILGRGMVDQDMMDLLRGVGFFGVRRHDVHLVLERAILRRSAEPHSPPFPDQVVLGVGTGGLIRQNRPADPFWAHTALFAHLNRLDVQPTETTAESSGPALLLDLRPRLKLATSKKDAVAVLLDPLLAALASAIPNLSAADLRPDMTPADVGSDSMRGMAVDNWLRRTTGVSIGQGINALSIRAICEEVVRKGNFLEKKLVRTHG